jgi:hypothetical protein
MIYLGSSRYQRTEGTISVERGVCGGIVVSIVCVCGIMSRLLDALDVVMGNMVQNLHHGRRLFLVVVLEWLWRHVDTMVLVAATWSLSYHVAAFCFGHGMARLGLFCAFALVSR